METIINYKISEFLQIQDENLIQSYMVILDLLEPLKEINNPIYKWYKNQPKTIQIKPIKELSFGEVSNIKDNFNEGSIQGIFEAITLITGLKDKHIIGFTILEFYGIISNIKSELIELANLEMDNLADDTFDVNVDAVNAKQRMTRFGVLNVIDSLAKEDILKWTEIEKLPYLTVYTKLLMDKTKNDIQAEIAELQRRKQPK